MKLLKKIPQVTPKKKKIPNTTYNRFVLLLCAITPTFILINNNSRISFQKGSGNYHLGDRNFSYSHTFILNETNSSKVDLVVTAPDATAPWTRVKVLCFVETCPATINSRAAFIQETWGARCDKTLYISDVFNETFPAIAVTNYTGRKYLWAKTRSTFQYIYDNFRDDFDWFMKTDDDTYVIVENLKKFLFKKNPNNLEYFGKFFKPFVKGGYPSGGAGYVIGKEGLNRLVNIGFKADSALCEPITTPKAEDILFGRCMETSGVALSRSAVDLEGRELFHSFTPQKEFNIPWKRIPFYAQFSIHGLGLDACCSKEAISYHYVRGSEMMFIDFLFYNFTRIWNP